MKKGLIILLTIVSGMAYAQSTEDVKRGKPDIPGTLLIDIGFNILNEGPADMDLKFFGSKSVNLYYQYDIPFGDSKFSFHPGIGLGMDKYRFQDEMALTNSRDATTGLYNVGMESTNLLFLPDTASFSKSLLAANYIDIPVEFRFQTNPYDKDRSFKVAIGGRIGFLYNAHTKLKYKLDGTDIKTKNHQSFNLNKFRYGTTFRMGIGWFNLFYYHNLSELFESDKGPSATSATNYTIGLTISGF